ncbi:MAG: hypothetical protein BWY63_02366 [Chloroflexi bacterium ADurb.Bin360]|nr:MAG: hypothetical protein BWY63_02366 [Chloroflexi bacterium ADurb.Bin360]
MWQLFNFDAKMQPLDQPGFGALQAIKGMAPHHTPGQFIAYAQNQVPTTLICQCSTILDQLFEVEMLFGFLELQVLALPSIQPCL